MKTRLTFFLPGILLLAMACNSNSLEYQHADKEDTIACNNAPVNTELFKEALYTFEEELKANYARKTADVAMGYRMYMPTATTGRVPNLQSVEQHTRNVITALKNEKDLWTMVDGKATLNYNHPLITCIGDNILDEDLKTTFNALVSTNSMTSRLFSSAIRSKRRAIEKDRFLATFVALDMYYARLMDVDFTKVPLPLEIPQKEPEATDPNPTAPSATRATNQSGD